MNTQVCPNCNQAHDVGVYVTGQKILCDCGIHFEVKRTVAAVAAGPATDSEATAAQVDKTASGRDLGSLDQTFIGSAARPEIPGYDLREILGRGGMGEVWRGYQRSLGREVAIKLLPPRLAKDPEFITRFEKEATALASLSHPNVIQIIDRGLAADHYYIVMEYVAGRTLRELMNEQNLSPQEALKIVAQVCRAIDYAHEKQIIHRDLKPENILIDERGNVKVADFGLAGIRQSEARLHLTATAVAMGTVNYMAPEQRRDARSVDGRADLYSLGVVLYELLTGELPIGRFKLPSEKGLDLRIDRIVIKSLQPDPEARYQRASAIGMDLEELIGSGGPARSYVGAPPEARTPLGPSAPASSRAAPSSSARRAIATSWRWLRVALMVVGALATLGFAIRWWTGRPSLMGKDDELLDVAADTASLHRKHGHLGPGHYPPNTNGQLFTAATWKEIGDGRGELILDFDPGGEEINAHAGSWKLEDGKLKATQAGSETGGQKLIPRAFVTRRYFSSDDFTAEVDITLRGLEDDFPVEENAQHFAELAFRIKDLQVSIFAIDGVGMRLLWRYFTADGAEVSGNSARDLENLVEDEMPVPPNGNTFTVKLSMKKRKNATEVDAFVNGQRFARKELIGLDGRVGKVALGCRNLHCDFDDLKVRGKFAPAPQSKLAEARPE